MPLTFAETPLYYKDAQGNYHRILSGADMTSYRTASAQDVIDAAQDADIASRAKTDEIGIVITGSRPSMAASPGQYVIVRGSTITGITDGLYTAVNALSPSTDVTAADLTAVSSGGLNDLITAADITSAVTFDENITGTNTRILVKGKQLYVYYQGESKTHSANTRIFALPSGIAPSSLLYHPCVVNNAAYGVVSVNTSGECHLTAISSTTVAGRIYASFSVPLL